MNTLPQIPTLITSTALVDYIHDLLRVTTTNSIIEGQVPSIVSRAVANGIWSLSYALENIHRITSADRKIETYSALLRDIPLEKKQKQEIIVAALEALDQIGDQSSRLSALEHLLPYLTKKHQRERLPQALDLAVQVDIEDHYHYSRAVHSLAPLLTKDLTLKAVDEVAKINHSETQAWAWAALARTLRGKEKKNTLARGLEAAFAIPEELQRANALCQFGDQLTGKLLTRALNAALTLAEDWRPRVMVNLAKQLNSAQQRIVFDDMLSLQHPWYRAYTLVGLIPYLEGTLLNRAIEAALQVDSDEAKAKILSQIDFPPEYVPRALEEIFSIQDEFYRLEALVGLYIHLNQVQQKTVLESASQIPVSAGQQYQYPYIILSIIKHLNEKQKQDVLAKVLSAITQIADEEDRSSMFMTLVDYLPDALLPNALQVALAFKIESFRSYVLGKLAPRLSSALVNQVLQNTTIDDYQERAFALMSLAEEIDQVDRVKILEFAWQAVKAIQPPWEASDLLVPLIDMLDGQTKKSVIEYTLEKFHRFRGDSMVPYLAKLMPYLEPEQRTKMFDFAFELTSKIVKPYDRTRALAALAEQAKSETKTRLLTSALEVALKVPLVQDPLDDIPLQDTPWRAFAIAEVAQHATGNLLTKALLALQKEDHVEWKGILVLQNILKSDRHFTKQQWVIIEEIISAMTRNHWRLQALAVLAQHTKNPAKKKSLLGEALVLSKTEMLLHPDIESLIALAVQFGDQPEKYEFVDLTINASLQAAPEFRISYLVKLLPLVKNPEDLLQQIREIILADLEKLRNQPRASLLSYLSTFTKEVFLPSTLAAIATSMIEACYGPAGNYPVEI